MRHLYLALTFVAVTGLVLAALVALALLIRARLGEPVPLQKKEKPGVGDIGRSYAPPAILKFGDRKGEKVISVEADQEQSIFLLHNALNDLDPRVKKFVIAVSESGDLEEAASTAGRNRDQVAAVLPRLKAYLRQRLFQQQPGRRFSVRLPLRRQSPTFHHNPSRVR